MNSPSTVIIVAADVEWEVVTGHYGVKPREQGAFDCFAHDVPCFRGSVPVIFLHSGCGKVPAAAATQYAIDKWHPSLIVNIGTCGAVDPKLEVGNLVLATKTVIYDIRERSGGEDEMIERFSVCPDVPSTLSGVLVHHGTMVTADQDLDPARITELREAYDASAADWESGAIAYTATKLNNTPCRILRVVSDRGTDIYASHDTDGDDSIFRQRVKHVLPPVLDEALSWVCAPDKMPVKPVQARAVASRLLYGAFPDDEDPYLIFIPAESAHELAALQRAIWQSKTWGEFRRRVTGARFDEVISAWEAMTPEEYVQETLESRPELTREKALAEYQALPLHERIPRDDDPFSGDAVPGVCDAFWPEWPAQEALNWFPLEVEEAYGCPGTTMHNGRYLHIPAENEREVIMALQEHGYECTRDDPTVLAASGYVDESGRTGNE